MLAEGDYQDRGIEMANKIQLNKDTPIVWADHAGDFGDSPVTGGTEKQITLAALASAGARQGAKADLGDPRADLYDVIFRLEWDVAPADGATASLYMAPSPHVGASTANPGGVSGADAAFTGTAGSTIGESLLQLDFIGDIPCTNDAAPIVQQRTFRYAPPEQHVSPVVLNEGGQALEGDDVEMSIIMQPVPPEVQNPT